MSERLLEAQLGELCPPLIGRTFVGVVACQIEVLAAHAAKPSAVGPAQQLRRERQRERVTRPRMYVELVARDVRGAQLVTFSGLGDLAGVHLERRRGLLETAHAWPAEL